MLYTYCKNFLFKIMLISAENTRMGSSAESQQLLVHTHTHTHPQQSVRLLRLEQKWSEGNSS